MDLLLQSDAALDQDRTMMQFVIIALLIVAALLGLLTVWYWKQTNPAKSSSTISGSSRYDDLGNGDYHKAGEYQDDGFRAQPQVSSNGSRPTHLPGDSFGKPPPSEDRRRPVVRLGPGRNPAPTQPASSEDAWAAMTRAQKNEAEHF